MLGLLRERADAGHGALIVTYSVESVQTTDSCYHSKWQKDRRVVSGSSAQGGAGTCSSTAWTDPAPGEYAGSISSRSGS